VSRLLDAARRELDNIAGILSAVRQDVADIGVSGPRARFAAMAVISVGVSTTAALTLHLDDVWWAAISGLMALQATIPASVRKAVLRIGGTVAGAVAAVLLTPWLAYDHVAFCLVLMIVTTIGVIGVQVSPHGYAWLFTAITFDLILLMSLDRPLLAFDLAYYRTTEVVIGSLSAVVIALLLAPEEEGAAAASPPGWSDLLGAQWPVVLHAIRSGITVALIPIVWSWFELVTFSQMAVTVAVVMAVPILSDHPVDQGRQIVNRALHRIIGCFLGGLAALACLGIPLTEYLPFMLVLSAGVYVATYVQGSQRGVGYVGTQAAFVFIITLVQGFGPPTNIWVGVDRFGGMMGGLSILLVVSLLLWPEPEPRAVRAADQR
jgi:uncharacterized membrane protein YccC